MFMCLGKGKCQKGSYVCVTMYGLDNEMVRVTEVRQSTRSDNYAIGVSARVVGIQPIGQALTKPLWVKIWIKSFYRTRTCLDCCSMHALSLSLSL